MDLLLINKKFIIDKYHMNNGKYPNTQHLNFYSKLN